MQDVDVLVNLALQGFRTEEMFSSEQSCSWYDAVVKTFIKQVMNLEQFSLQVYSPRESFQSKQVKNSVNSGFDLIV